MHIRNNRRHLHRILQVLKENFWTGGHPDHFSRKDWPNTGEQTPGVVRRHTNRHKRDKRTTQTWVNRGITKLENAGYRHSENKSEFFKSEIECVGHKIDQNGIRPLQDKLRAIQELEEPKNQKELKSFLGAIQYLSKHIENLSAQTDLLRQLLKKKNKWNWTTEHSEAFNRIKRKITEIPCLAHYSSIRPNTITTDASTKWLGATLWQEQDNGDLKPTAFVSRCISDTEKKYAVNELELIAVVCGLEHFRLYIYGNPRQTLDGLPSSRTADKTQPLQQNIQRTLNALVRSISRFYKKRKPYRRKTSSAYWLLE